VETVVNVEYLKKLIQRKYKSVDRFAQEVGVTRQYVYLILRGERSPSLRRIALFADALGVQPAALLEKTTRRSAHREVGGEARPAGATRGVALVES
jgi:transcriptional regulator with XRE-family HTH domain